MQLMKMKRPRITRTSRYEAAVTEAVALYRKLQAHAKFGDARDDKLSAKAYLAQALKNGKTTVEKLRKLEALLAQEPESHPWIDTLLDEVYRGASATRYDQGCNLDPVIANLHMLIRHDITSVLMEVMQTGTTVLEVVALGVLHAVEQHPDAFGAIEDRAAHEAAKRERQARFDALCQEIVDVAMEEQQVQLTHAGADTWRVTFKWAGNDTQVGYGTEAAAALGLIEKLARKK